jgi:hypothetical protein
VQDLAAPLLHWIGLHWIGLHWVGLHWIGLHWIGLHWVALHWVALHWVALQWVALQWVALQWVALIGPVTDAARRRAGELDELRLDRAPMRLIATDDQQRLLARDQFREAAVDGFDRVELLCPVRFSMRPGEHHRLLRLPFGG